MNSEDENRGKIYSSSVLIKEDLKIFSYDKSILKIFEAENKEYFSELVDDYTSASIKSLIYLVKKEEKEHSKKVFVKDKAGVSKLFNLFVSEIQIKGEKLFIVNFIYNHDKVLQRLEYDFPETEVRNLIDDKNLLEIVLNIIDKFPFSIIEKSNLVSRANAIKNIIALKDSFGKYIFANNAYNEYFKISFDLNKRFEKEVIDSETHNIFEIGERYVSLIKKPISFDFSKHNSDNSVDLNQKISVIPIWDSSNNISAFLYVGKLKEKIEQNFNESIVNEMIESLWYPAAIYNKNYKTIAINEDFLKILNDSNLFEYVKNNIDKISEQGINYLSEEFESYDSELNILHLKLIDNKKNMYFAYIKNNYKLENKGIMYDKIIHSSPEAIIIYDTDTLRFLEVNENALDLYGYKRDEFLGMDLTDLYDPEDIQTLIDSSNTKTIEGEFSGPWRQKTKSGESIFVEIGKSTIEFNTHKAHLNVIRNITSNIEKEKELQIYKGIYEKTDDLIFLTDKEGFITYINNQVTIQLGYRLEELNKRPFVSLTDDENRGKVNSNIFNSPRISVEEIEIKLKKKKEGVVDVKIIPKAIYGYNGNIESFSILTKLNQKKIVHGGNMEKDKNTENQIDSSFLSHLFHEILTPINVIIGFGQELIDSIKSPNEEQKESAEIIRQNQKILLQTMDIAAEYASLVSDDVNLKPELLQFVDILDDIEENATKGSFEKNTELTYGKISSSLSFVSDKHKFSALLSLFLNISLKISNSSKIYLSAFQHENNSCVISIRDSREGLSEELYDNFESIFNDDENLIRQKYGFSRFSIRLLRKLLEVLNVKNKFINKADGITEYALIVPKVLEFEKTRIIKREEIKKVNVNEKFVADEPERYTGNKYDQRLAFDDKREIEKEPKEIKRTQRFSDDKISRVTNLDSFEDNTSKFIEPETKKHDVEPIVKGLSLNNYNCLYVEDQVDSQILFKVQMKELRKIEFATSFEKALPLLNSTKFDLIVLDINLQGEFNGLDALRYIRKLPGYSNIPIIAVTAYVLPGDKENFIQAGFSDFISKPILREKFIDSLEKLMG